MARKLIWARRASEDLEAIAEFIAKDSQTYAAAVVRTILQKTRMLQEFPFAGRVVPELGDEMIREIFAYSYRGSYQIDEETFRIAAVIHGKRLLDISLKP